MNAPRGRSAPGTAWRSQGLVGLSLGLLIALLALATPLAAQGLSATGGGFNVQRRLFYESSVHEQTGMLVGGSGAVRLGPIRVGMSGVMGTLKGDGSATNPDVKTRTTALTLQLAVMPGALIGAQYEVRRFEADAGVTLWKLIGATVRLEPGLGLAGLRGLLDVSVLPSSEVSGGPKLKMATQATVGVSFNPARGPFQIRFGYRFERYDIAATEFSPERYEQFRGIVAEAGVRLGR